MAKKIIRKWLYIAEGEDILLDILLGTIIGNKIMEFLTPIWIFFIGASGSGKTEILNSVKNSPDTCFISNFSTKSFASGYSSKKQGKENKDFSLLPKIDKKVLIIKDFTTLISARREVRREIFGILRDAFDGHYAKAFGSEAETKEYNANFGVVVGCTPAIDKYQSFDNDLGERFLKVRFKKQNTRDMVERALAGFDQETEMREEISKYVLKCLEIDGSPEKTKINFENDKLKKKIILLSDIGSKLRTHVSRDGAHKIVHFEPEPEVGTRLVKQISKLLHGIAIVREKTEITDEEYQIALRIIHDNMTSYNVRILQQLLIREGTLEYIIEETKIPRATATIYLEDLELLDIINRNKREYFIADSAKSAFDETGFSEYLMEEYEKKMR
ncbi:MAG: hypothetical protein GF353_02330 [Candidatus Lokiarchaeota archaeon]|nr:hypothetical protein [Candidatus Lokiarchaeota archaeon]